MIIHLNDVQVARVLELCSKIAAIQNQLPKPPQGSNVSLEIAQHLRGSLEKHNDDLLELSTLLR